VRHDNGSTEHPPSAHRLRFALLLTAIVIAVAALALWTILSVTGAIG
jgi:multisubunit Na+/H+ antiporter MnhC subunit